MANIANIAVVVLFLSAMAGMGLYFLKRNNNSEEYFLGGRKIPGWALGLSMVGTSISSITLSCPSCCGIRPGLPATDTEPLHADCGVDRLLDFYPVLSTRPKNDRL